jgi:hypothetical protein
MRFLAESIIAVLLEDRVDDLVTRYPDMRFSRQQLTSWMDIDPSPNKKYFPWIVKQVALKKFKPQADGEKMHDMLMSFERFLVIPDFQAPRDIYQYDAKSFAKTVKKYSGLQSKSQKERQARQQGARPINRVAVNGANYELYEITNRQELMNRAWSAYGAENPNWKGKKLKPPTPGQEDEREWDGLWCVRFPTYADSYLSEGPFHMVYKNGGVYAGIVWEKGECQTLDNKGISLGQAEEIYPLVKDHMPNKLTGNCAVFANLKFLRGEVKDGETIEPGSGRGGNVLDLSGSTLSKLPSNLTVRGSFNVSGTNLAELPPGLSVIGGKLMIQGTKITRLPIDLTVTEMEWSAPLTYEETVKLYYRNKLPELKRYFWSVPKYSQLPDDQREKAWIEFQSSLMNYFLHDPDVEKNVKVIYRNVSK